MPTWTWPIVKLKNTPAFIILRIKLQGNNASTRIPKDKVVLKLVQHYMAENNKGYRHFSELTVPRLLHYIQAF